MDFSVIIPSRNRPLLLERAVLSVLQQKHASKEIIIVNDGSDMAHQAQYEQLAARFSSQIILVNLERTPRGHGPSYAINRGTEIAQGEFLCFLDDDDYWIDADHLDRAQASISSAGSGIDMYLSNQEAYRGERRVIELLWLQPLAERLSRTHAADTHGVYRVSTKDLMGCDSFPHLNNTIVRRSLYMHVGGMDENIRYECEWDLYFRLANEAREIQYFPGIISRHNVPDPNANANASTSVTSLQKLLSRLIVMDKALLLTQAPTIHAVAKRIRGYTLKRISGMLTDSGNFQLAFYYSREALATSPTIKWLGYCGYLGLRAAFNLMRRAS